MFFFNSMFIIYISVRKNILHYLKNKCSILENVHFNIRIFNINLLSLITWLKIVNCHIKHDLKKPGIKT